MTQTISPELSPLDCRTCGGNCCRYFALQLDTPRSQDDFDNIRWYLAHEKVVIFIEKKAWYLQINNACRFLNSESECAIYEKRPKICRDYGWDPTGKTECHGTDRPCDHDEYFQTLEEFEAFLIRKGKKWSSQGK